LHVWKKAPILSFTVLFCFLSIYIIVKWFLQPYSLIHKMLIVKFTLF
jgi:hypothetical protein